MRTFRSFGGRLVLTLTGFLAIRENEALVVDVPCCSEFPHMQAAFNPMPWEELNVSGVLLSSEKDEYLCDIPEENDNELEGKIALVPRGTCRFIEKVLAAQSKGAIGVVVYNMNQPYDEYTLVRMSVDFEEEASGIEIPSVFVSYMSFTFIDELMREQMIKIENGDSTLSPGVHVVLNTTGEQYQMTDYDASPLFLKSIFFMLQLLLIVWSMVAVFYLINFFKARWARKKRLEVVKKLPTRIFRAPGAEPASPATSDCDEVDHLTIEPISPEDPDAEMKHPVTDHHRLPVDDKDIEMSVLRSHNAREDDGAGAGTGAGSSAGAKPRSGSCASGTMADCFALESCVICLCEFEDGEKLTLLPCKHAYHKECIEPWLISKSAMCPICKQSILPSGDSRSLDEIANSETNNGENDNLQSRSLLILVGGIVAMAVGTTLLYVLKLDE